MFDDQLGVFITGDLEGGLPETVIGEDVVEGLQGLFDVPVGTHAADGEATGHNL
ncbi:hypothetical protein CGBL_0129020 [Corynebacterium glutamicum]|nr:hypothetical protein CGBL_0129020 [Corynebacterium glutamicum]